MYRSEKLIYSNCFYCLRRRRPDSFIVFRANSLLRCYSNASLGNPVSPEVLPKSKAQFQCSLSYLGKFSLSFEQRRALVLSQCLREDSKVEQQLEILKEKGKDAKKTEKGKNESEIRSTLPQNIDLARVEERFVTRAWTKVKKEIKHYYNGFRLFSLETMISVRLLRKIANGDALTRRERKQLLRTVADIFRLVPFLIFIIIPFMEFLLPFALKLFPGMLPSTFEEKASKEMKAKQRFKLKLEMAKFLQDTVEQMAVKRGSSSTSETAQKFSEFMTKVREGDLAVSNEEILKFSKAFRDSLMMDNLERQQLMALCKILNIPTIGNTNIMRFQIKLRMRRIKAEDLQIQQEENISKLETSDLQSLVRERGMRAYGVSKQRLIKQLEEWVDLHLNDKVPLSLLLLSRTLYIPPSESGADPTTTEQLKATISSLPSETSDTVKLRLEELESGQIDNQARLAKVKREQEAIVKEAAEKEESIKQAQELAIKTKQEETERILDTALHDFPPGYTSVDQAPVPETHAAPELTPDVIKAVEEVLTDLAESKSQVSEERDDFNELVQEIQDYNASLKETLEVASEDKVKVRRGSKLLSRYLQYSVKRMRPVVDRIEADRKEAKDSIKQLSEDKKEALDEQTVKMIDSKIETHEGTVATIDEVRSAMKTLSEVSDDEIMSEIVKIIDPDKDGIVEVDTVVKAIEFMSTYSGENNSPEALKDLIEVLEKEIKMKKKISSALSSLNDKEKISAQL